jgi:hypothetical protein
MFYDDTVSDRVADKRATVACGKGRPSVNLEPQCLVEVRSAGIFFLSAFARSQNRTYFEQSL